uniref:DNA-damage-inducible SOS response protein n=2 Tax=Ralstonia syzygii TaxID=28097 RepID=G3A8J1_9RALS|nr:membrane hypothetical protein [Ralstonia syzygii R24]
MSAMEYSSAIPAASGRPAQWHRHRRVLALAFPIVLANLTQPLLSAVDTAVAGHLPGPAYLGGVALGGVFFNFVFWGFGFLRTACLLAAFGWFAHAGAQQGDVILAANALLLNFLTFMAYGLDGFAHAAEALVGAALGARDGRALRSAIRVSTLWSVLGAALFSLVYAVAGGAIVGWLTDQPAVREAARHDLVWAALLPVVSVWGFQFDGVFIGATRTRELLLTMAFSAIAFWLLAVALQPRWGNPGLWFAMLAFMALRGMTLGLLLPRVLHAVPPRAA